MTIQSKGALFVRNKKGCEWIEDVENPDKSRGLLNSR